jgi:hypothetical protein
VRATRKISDMFFYSDAAIEPFVCDDLLLKDIIKALWEEAGI